MQNNYKHCSLSRETSHWVKQSRGLWVPQERFWKSWWNQWCWRVWHYWGKLKLSLVLELMPWWDNLGVVEFCSTYWYKKRITKSGTVSKGYLPFVAEGWNAPLLELTDGKILFTACSAERSNKRLVMVPNSQFKLGIILLRVFNLPCH